MEEGGGNVIFPSGKLELKGCLRLVPTNYVGAEVKLKGNRGSIIEISMGNSGIAFYAGNLNIFSIEDLIVVGKNVAPGDPEFFDAKYVVYSNFVQQTNIIRSQFYGLAVPFGGAVVYFGNTDAKVLDSQFDGSLGQYPTGSVIMAENTRGLTVSRSTFLDYAVLHGEFFSKVPMLVGAWIMVKGGASMNANGIRRVVVEDSRFDEGAAIAISIENVPWVYMTGNSINVSGISPGKGVYLKNIEHAKIEQSWFGFSPNPRPALDLVNIKALEVTSLKLSDGVYFWNRQNVMNSSIRFCEQCR
ncbi:MAG TPA: hypothetical protein PKY59_21555 [Pyrinomonadaceae bacterium]|nr:hypothetical protein [Pyrinomonadaceae bacterium]